MRGECRHREAADRVEVLRPDSPLVETVVDPTTLNEVQRNRVPAWWPSALTPRARVVRELSGAELALSGALAGGATEVARVALLHPLDTVKSRLQADRSAARARGGAPPPLARDLYAGLPAALVVAAPSAAAYFGVRDLARRALLRSAAPAGDAAAAGAPLAVQIGAALAANAASLLVRAPAEVVVTRAQVEIDTDGDGRISPRELFAAARRANATRDAAAALGAAASEGLSAYPMLLATELPYLLARVALVCALSDLAPPATAALPAALPAALGGGAPLSPFGADVARTVAAACFCAALTNPLDVARTRLLVARRAGGADREGAGDVGRALRDIWRDEGAAGLLAGVRARTLYSGVVVAGLVPLRSLGYVGIRDAIILDLFR